MRLKLLEVLACPKCGGDLSCNAEARVGAGEEVESGELKCGACGAVSPVRAGIPRFVPEENYASSFGYQWNLFKSEQLDSVNGTRLSEARPFFEKGWAKERGGGKRGPDAGRGA